MGLYMKTKIFYFFIFLSLRVFAAEPNMGLPLVFDPQSKKYFVGNGSRFMLKANQGTGLIDKIEVAVDNEDYRPYNQNIEFKTEGKHSLKFRALNPVNNWSPVQFIEVFVDLTPPATEVKYSEDWTHQVKEKDVATLYFGPKSSLTLSAQDNLSGVSTIEYSFDGTTFIPYTKAIPLDKAGKQILWYRSVDRVGNLEPVKKLEFISDILPPNTELKLSGNPTVIKGQSFLSDGISFSLTPVDEHSQVKQTWMVIDGKQQAYIKPIYFLQEGLHNVSYYSVDHVGNAEKPKTFSFYTVSSPPRTNGVPLGKFVNMGGINYANTNFQLKLEAKDNIVGLDRVEFKVDNDSNFRTYLEPLSFTAGYHTVSFRSVDRAGNVEPIKTYTVHIVNTNPETKISTAQPLVVRDGLTYSPAPNIVTLTVGSDSGVGIQETWYSVNDGTFTPYRGPFPINNDKQKIKISFKSVDKLGNEEAPKTATYHMINSTPLVDLFISNGKSAEEMVRTQYLEQPAGQAPAEKPEARKPAAQPKK
jgi:large repetitive protein